MALEIVDWVDSRSDDGWTEKDGLEMQVAKITTVGHVAQETDEVLCIASSLDEQTGQLSGIMYIPKQCIRARREVIPGKSVPKLGGSRFGQVKDQGEK